MKNIIHIGCNDGNDHVFKFVCENKKDIGEIILIDANFNVISKARKTYNEIKNTTFLNLAITPIDINGCEIEIFTPITDDSSNFVSVNRDFVRAHVHHNNILSTKVRTMSLQNLIDQYKDTTHLFLDTEGLDVLNVFSVDFDKNKIEELTFEYIHSDGIVRHGKRLNSLLGYLEQFGFSFEVAQYNVIAKRKI